LKQLLLNLFALILFVEIASAQAPNISYAPTTLNVSINTAFTTTPSNSGSPVPATIYGQVTTVAGHGVTGYVDGAALTTARFNSPQGIVGDGAGNIFICDRSSNAVRELTSAGQVITLAGDNTVGAAGNVDATGTAARFNAPSGIAIDASHTNLYVSDYNNKSIRKIVIATGVVTTLAIPAGTLTGPYGLNFDAAGNLLVADEIGYVVIRIDLATNTGTVVAGNGTSGYTNSATPTSAQFDGPEDIQTDAAGNIFVADYIDNAIREISTAGVVTTFAGNAFWVGPNFVDGVGTAARFSAPTGLAMGSGNVLYVADKDNNVIRRIFTDGTVSTVAGNNAAGDGQYADGTGTVATFYHPFDLYIDPNGVGYISDARNGTIREIQLTGYTIDKALPAGLTFDQTTGTISGTATAYFAPTSYTVMAFNATGYSTTTFTLSCANNWVGNTSTDWNTTTNWDLGHVPTTTENVQIGMVPYTGSSAQPTLAADATVASIQFGSNNIPELTIPSGLTLTATNGIQINAGSTSKIDGPGNLNIGGTSTINATGSFNAASNLVITLAASSTLTNNGTCTLESDANGSASIAAIPASSSVIGNISVQRYLSGIRSYRLLSSPVYEANKGGNNIYTIDYLANSTYISGTNFPDTYSTGGTIKPGNPSLYIYRENYTTPTNTAFTSSNFRGISDLSASPDYTLDVDGGPYNIPVANGYLCFFRGGLGTATPFIAGSAADPGVVTATGSLNQGTIVVRDWFTPGSNNLSYTAASPVGIIGFNLVGNPYPSSIDWDQFSASSATNGVYGPNLATYMELLNPNTGSYAVYYAGSGASGPLNTNGATNIIPSGAGFFVLALNTSASLTFNENAKTSGQVTGSSLLMSTTAQNNSNIQYLRLQMVMDTLHKEDIVIRFDKNAQTAFDRNADALYIKGFAPVSLSSLSSDRVPLAVNQQPLPKLKAVSVALNISASASGSYKMNLKDLAGLPKLYDIWLMDAYKKDSLDMRANPVYTFDINTSDTASFGANRLSLVIRQNPAYAYKLLNFAADKVAGTHQVNVVWNTEYEGNYTNFTVERSIDNGETYQVLGGVAAADQGTYSFLDKNPVTGANLYRLKQEDINNTITYSKVVTIQYSNLANSIVGRNLSVYPNPAASTVSLALTSQSTNDDAYNIRIMNSTGLVVKEVISSQPSWQGNISNLQPGTYIVRVTDNKTQNLVGENKFIKL
jgi:hypothetical protein